MTLNTAYLKRDAGNRAARAFLIGLGIDVLVGVVLVLATYFNNANAWGDVEWGVLGLLLVKSALQAVGSFIARRFIDPSGIPMPLPPADPGEPADPEAPAGEHRILGKALYSPQEPTVEKPGGMRARDEQGRTDALGALLVVLVVVVILVVLGVL